MPGLCGLPVGQTSLFLWKVNIDISQRPPFLCLESLPRMSSTQDTSVGESMGNCQQRIGEKQRVALGLEKIADGLWAGPLGTLLQPSCLETQGGLRSVLTGTWLVTGTLFHWTQIDFFFML